MVLIVAVLVVVATATHKTVAVGLIAIIDQS